MKQPEQVALERQRMTDAELMTGIAAGDMEAWGELSRRHQEVVFRLAWRMLGEQSKAEDIVQEAFIRIYQASKSYRPEAKFTTWLYRITANLCLDEKRRARRNTSLLSALIGMWSAKTTDPSGIYDEQVEKSLLVRKAINRLNQRQRLVLLLHRFDGLGHDEIASITGWSQSAVESLLVRAYKKLRKELVVLEKKGNENTGKR